MSNARRRDAGNAKKIAASFLDLLPSGSNLVCFVATDYEPNPAHDAKPHSEPKMRRKFSVVARLSVPNKKTLTVRLRLLDGESESEQLRVVCREVINKYRKSLPKPEQDAAAAAATPTAAVREQNKLLAETIVGLILANSPAAAAAAAAAAPMTEEEELEALLQAQEKSLVKMTKKAAKQKEAASCSTGDKRIQ